MAEFDCDYTEEFSVSTALRQAEDSLRWSLIMSSQKAQTKFREAAREHLSILSEKEPEMATELLKLRDGINKNPLESFKNLGVIRENYEKKLREEFFKCAKECALPMKPIK